MSSRAAAALAVAPIRKMERLAIAAAEAVGADIAGVDVLVDRRRRADGARGQQHAGMERPAKGERAQHRRGDRIGADG